MHSNDFDQPWRKIKSSTKEDIEKEQNIIGMIAHLKKLGWSNYQWNLKEENSQFKGLSNFAEFFAPYYHGYLRGDSEESLYEAVKSCLNEAQKFTACEVRTGHKYRERPKYENGLCVCKHCGFNGFSPQINTLKSEVFNLRIHLKIVQEQLANIQEKTGLTGLMVDDIKEADGED